MGGSQRCLGCGNDVAFAAPFCPRCGRATAAPLRDLERLDVAPEPAGSKQQAIAQSGGRGSRRRGIATLVGIGAVLAATVVLLSGGGGDGGDDGSQAVAESTSTRPGAPNTHLIYPDPTKPGETTSTRPPTTSRPPTTTATTTTLVAFIGDAPAPVLGEDTGGLSVYSYERTVIRRVELDAGRVTTAPLPSNTDDFYMMTMRGDRLVLSVGSTERTIARDLSGGLSEASVFRAGNVILGTDIRWSQEYDEGQTSVVLQHPGQDELRFDIPAGLNVQGFVGDRIVLGGGGRIFTLDLMGRLRDYAPGNVVSANGQWMLRWSCDADASCGFWLGTAADADVRRVQGATGYMGYDYLGFATPLVAPDGEHAVLPSVQGAPGLVELATGKVLVDQVGMWGNFAWSPDGRWLFQYDERGDVQAVSTADGHVVELLSVLPGTTSGSRVIGVG